MISPAEIPSGHGLKGKKESAGLKRPQRAHPNRATMAFLGQTRHLRSSNTQQIETSKSSENLVGHQSTLACVCESPPSP
jgi:hypothetical protein